MLIVRNFREIKMRSLFEDALSSPFHSVLRNFSSRSSLLNEIDTIKDSTPTKPNEKLASMSNEIDQILENIANQERSKQKQQQKYQQHKKKQENIQQQQHISSTGKDGFSSIGNHSISSNAPRTPLTSLKYFSMYPKLVQRWILDAKTPRGFYDEQGRWRQVSWPYIDPRLQPHGRQQDSLLTQKKLNPREDQENAGERALEDDGRAQLLAVAEEVGELEEAVKRDLPSDLVGGYRFDITPEEAEKLPEKVKRILSLRNATRPEINLFRIRRAVRTWQRSPPDTGSSEVQVATLTERIRYINEHLKTHRKDQTSIRALSLLVNRRKQMLKYLKRTRISTYFKVLKEFGLRDIR